MPILGKAQHATMMAALSDRYRALLDKLEARDLSSPSEGCRKGYWRTPDALCATVGDAVSIRLALADFRAALKEVERLK